MGGTEHLLIQLTLCIEIATVGNALDFGNLSANRHFACGLSNPTRAIVAGGKRTNACCYHRIFYNCIKRRRNRLWRIDTD